MLPSSDYLAIKYDSAKYDSVFDNAGGGKANQLSQKIIPRNIPHISTSAVATMQPPAIIR